MTHEQAVAIHRAARALVMHDRMGDLHAVDLQRYRLALWGNALNRQISASDLIRSAYASAGMRHD